LEILGLKESHATQCVPNNISPDELNAAFPNFPACDSPPVVLQICELQDRELPNINLFYFEVERLLSSITTSAQGVDGIKVTMLKMLGDAVILALEDILNLLLNHSIFPGLWRNALVTPIPKAANPITPSDFKPISITCTAAKLIRKAAHQQALQHLVSNNIIDTFQSGLHPAHSITTASLMYRIALNQPRTVIF